MDPKVFPPSNQTPTKNISSPLFSHFISMLLIPPPTKGPLFSTCGDINLTSEAVESLI